MLETSARLLRLLSLLQTPRDWTGAELAERLEVDVRTVRRDIEKLRTLGYPVEGAPRGAGGGGGGGGALGAEGGWFSRAPRSWLFVFQTFWVFVRLPAVAVPPRGGAAPPPD
uniref:helix-turn-helix domain-containing protein n=1 Tax=Nocardia abscessus TaxID=120957 RepID=UPI0024579C8D